MKMKSSRTGTRGSSRAIPWLTGLLWLTAALTVVAFVYVSRHQAYDEQYIARASEQRVLAQRIAKYALESVAGNETAFVRLRDARDQFSRLLDELKNGVKEPEFLPAAPGEIKPQLRELENAWLELRAPVDQILGNQDAILSIGEFIAVINEFVPQLQEASDDVARLLVDKKASAGDVYTATRQSYLAANIDFNVSRVLTGGSVTALAVDEFSHSTELFGRVLDGLIKGDKEMGIARVRDAEGQEKLANVAELFESVRDHVNEIVDLIPAVLPVLEAVGEKTLELSAQTALEQGQVLPDMDQPSELARASDLVIEATSVMITAYGDQPGRLLVGPFKVDNRALAALGGVLLLLLILLGLLLLRDSRRRERDSAAQNQRNQEAIRRLLDEMGDLADGDLTVEATVTEDITGAIADSINYAIEAMRGLVTTINETSVKVSSSAQETRATAMHLAEASEHQREQITNATGIVREMSQAMEKVAEDATSSFDVAQRSVDIASKGGETVRRTIDGMDRIREQIQETSKRIKRLGESSQEIGNIVELIEDIADQTNILALNAAMQAAMAGEAGRGFAVVADEVQRLAERATNATKQIEALVKTIQADTNEAVSSMESSTSEVVSGAEQAEAAGEALQEIEQVSQRIAEITHNISESAQNEAREARTINDTMSVIQEITNQTTEGTNQTSSSIGILAEMANELRQSVAGFRLPEEG